jgi:hypothetical protein
MRSQDSYPSNDPRTKMSGQGKEFHTLNQVDAPPVTAQQPDGAGLTCLERTARLRGHGGWLLSKASVHHRRRATGITASGSRAMHRQRIAARVDRSGDCASPHISVAGSAPATGE